MPLQTGERTGPAAAWKRINRQIPGTESIRIRQVSRLPSAAPAVILPAERPHFRIRLMRYSRRLSIIKFSRKNTSMYNS